MASESTPMESNSTRNWLVMTAVGVGSLLGSLDGSIVSVALPFFAFQAVHLLALVRIMTVTHRPNHRYRFPSTIRTSTL